MVLAMVICDHVWQDPATGKQTLLGCFEEIHANDFPVELPRVAVYVEMTGGRGEVALALEITETDEETVVFRQDAEVEFSDPRAVRTIAFDLVDVEIPKPGEYNFDLYAGGIFVMARRMLFVATSSE